MNETDDEERLSDVLVERIKLILAGQDPDVQGSVLAQAVAIWLAGHYPLGAAGVERIFNLWLLLVRDLLPLEILSIKDMMEPSKEGAQ